MKIYNNFPLIGVNAATKSGTPGTASSFKVNTSIHNKANKTQRGNSRWFGRCIQTFSPPEIAGANTRVLHAHRGFVLVHGSTSGTQLLRSDPLSQMIFT